MKRVIALIWGFSLYLLSFAAGDAVRGGSTPERILPQVARWVPANGGSFVLTPACSYRLEGKGVTGDAAEAFRVYLDNCPLAMRSADKKESPAIRIKIGPKTLKDTREGAYQLIVERKGISIQANGVAGAFYAIQSLLQLQAADDEGRIACCKIEDAPRYAYRGLMFDVVRHFHGKDFILKQIDLMAQLKMNRLHLHLTDNEGWRIALDCAPEMVRKGAFGESWWFNHVMSRKPLVFAEEPSGYIPGTVYDDGRVYGGYYSKEDLREIIAFAATRQIEIIPEIEFPGHNQALLHAHPEFFCQGEHKVNNVVCLGKENVFTFYEKVLEEVMELFPTQYLHIGGDEAKKSNWNACPLCQQRIADEQLKDVYELQSYGIRRMEKFINGHGKRLIGWDEILEGGLSDNATVMSWRGTEGGVEAIRMNHDVVMSPSTFYYLDFGQDAPYKEPLAFNSYLPLEVVYSYEPEDDIIAACGEDYDPSILKHLLGVQGNLWSECIVSDSQFEYMLYPRAFAIAENGWSPKGSKNYPAFREKSLSLIERVKAQGYHPFELASEVGHRPEAVQPVPNLALGAKATWTCGGKAESADKVVDGWLGDWAIRRNPRWQEFGKKEVTLDVDLGEIKSLHYIGTEFVDYKARRFCVPADTEFFVSEDGVHFTPLSIPQMRLSEDRMHFSILTVGGTVDVRARYVRLRFNTGKQKVRGYISEIMIN